MLDMERVTGGLTARTLVLSSDSPEGVTRALDWLLSHEGAAAVAEADFSSHSASYAAAAATTTAAAESSATAEGASAQQAPSEDTTTTTTQAAPS